MCKFFSLCHSCHCICYIFHPSGTNLIVSCWGKLYYSDCSCRYFGCHCAGKHTCAKFSLEHFYLLNPNVAIVRWICFIHSCLHYITVLLGLTTAKWPKFPITSNLVLCVTFRSHLNVHPSLLLFLIIPWCTSSLLIFHSTVLHLRISEEPHGKPKPSHYSVWLIKSER